MPYLGGTWGSTGFGQEERDQRGMWARVFLWFPQEYTGEAGSAGSGLARWHHCRGTGHRAVFDGPEPGPGW